MSGPATFSYAQAAKGRASTQANTTTGTAPPQADSHTKDDASSVTTGPDVAANTFSTSSEVSESAKSSQIDVEVAGPKKIVETAGDVNGTTAALKDEAAGTTRAGSETNASSTTPSATEKSVRQSNRSSEAADPKKGRKTRKGRTSDKDSEGEQVTAEPEKEVIPVKLYEAPPPSVNIWQQRAAAAKARQPSIQTAPVAGAESTTKSGPEVSTKTDSNTEPQQSGTATRSSRKPAEASRPAADSSSARRNPRGSRVSEKSEAPSSFPSSAVENVSLWPTPETAAAEDGKRKTASEPDKEKQEDGVKTTRPKRDWKKVEITPTVVFNTPLPQQRSMNKTRGGAAAQTGRVSSGRGHASSISMSSEKAQSGPSDAAAPKEGGESQERPREDTQPRAAPVPSEKAKRFSVDQPTQRKHSVPAVNRDFSAPKNETSKAAKSDSNSFGPRGEGQEGFRKEGGFAGHKESKPRRGGAHGNGRGGHNGQQPFMSNGHGSRSNTYSPPSFTAPGFSSNTYGGSRGGRGRPVSLANGSGIKTASNGASRMHGPPHSALPDFGQYPSYGFAPFSPQQDFGANHYPTILHEALKKQIEYYFSGPNLETDSFLKAQMDSQGFVPFEVIAGFPRIRSMSSQTIEFVRIACADCKEVDFVLADGHRELVRCRKNWQRWVVEGDGKDQTKESTRNLGPSNFVYKSWHSLHLNQNNHYYQQQPIPYPSYNPVSPPAFGPGHAFPGDMYPGYMNGPQFPAAVNGAQANGQPTTDNSPLNASVPEFSPVKTPMGFSIAAAFSPVSWEDQAMQSAQTFTDEEVASLHMVAQGKLANGTRDIPSESEDSAVPKTNGVSTNSEVLTTPELAPTEEGTMSPTYWRLDGTLAHVSDTNNKEAYADVHDRAIEQRRNAKSGELPTDMKRLYKFWSHLLTTKFNPGIYMEFRQYALEDATAEVPSKVGLSNLLQFYKTVLSKSQGGGLWPPEHPIYRLLQSHLDNAQQLVNSSEEQV